jgi:hypothetical protein
MHGSRSKIPSKKISSDSVALRYLIPASKGSFIVSLKVSHCEIILGIST